MQSLNKKIVLSHSGKQHSYHVAKALLDLGMLEKFFTSSYISSPWLQQQLTKHGDYFWSRRFIAGLGGSKVQSNWHFELKELLYARLFGNTEKTQNAIYQRDVSFDKYMTKQMAQMAGNTFWGFQGSCLNSLKAAKSAGKLLLYDFPSAHYIFGKKILEEERNMHPDWADSFAQLGLKSNYEKRLLQEPQLVDVIFAASTFSKRTITSAGISDEKIKVLPLGADIENISFNSKKSDKDSLKLLYVGRVTQAKGIKYLLEAIKDLNRKDVELHIIGYIHGKGEGLKPYKGMYQLHSPLSQQELFKAYQKYDALVLPSIFEGFGLVIVEAMAAGLPVIATPHTMGPDVIEEDQNGYLVPIRDVTALRSAIEKLANKSPEAFHKMRMNARHSAMNFTWDAYRERLKVFLEAIR